MITIIVAMDQNGGIGVGNGLPWPRIIEDMQHFRVSTLNRWIIMGRKTFDSLGSRPLPNRTNLVVSHAKSLDDGSGVMLVNDLDKVLRLNLHHSDEIFVIGGASINDQALQYATRLLITRVNGVYTCDTFWRPDLSGWKLTESTPVERDGQLICTFEEYRRSQ